MIERDKVASLWRRKLRERIDQPRRRGQTADSRLTSTMNMPQPLQTHLRYLPVALQQAIEKFAGLPGRHRTAEQLVSLVDGHLEAHGMAGDLRRSHFLSSALLIAKQRFGISAERRSDSRLSA